MPSIKAWLTVIEIQRTLNIDCSIIDSSRYLSPQPSIPRNIRNIIYKCANFQIKRTVFERYVHKLDANYDLRPFTTGDNFNVEDRANFEYRELT